MTDILTMLANSSDALGTIAVFLLGLSLIGGAALWGIKTVANTLEAKLHK